MLISKRKLRLDMTLIDSIVYSYLDYIKSLEEEFTCSEISEIMRYSLCKALGLDTRGYTKRVERIGVGAANVIQRIISLAKIDIGDVDMKKGLLEACVHCIEASRYRVLEA